AGIGEVPHNALRGRAWDRLLDLLEDRIATLGSAGDDSGDAWNEGWGDVSPGRGATAEAFDAYGTGWDADEATRDVLENDDELRAMFDGAWPLLDPDALLRGLLSSPRMLRRCAPGLSESEIETIAAAAGRDGDAPPLGSRPWTDVDLPLLDAARVAVGDPRGEVRRRRAMRDEAEAQRVMSDVVADLIGADDGDLRVMSMLRGQDLRHTLTEASAVDRDPLAGPFAHLVVDEAQELSDAQWRMLLRRCPSGSLTIVGDRAQARRGFTESWPERFARVGLNRTRVATLEVNYRTPEEVMEVAAPVIRAAIPDANVPVSIRRTGIPVERRRRAELDALLDEWERTSDGGTAVVIGVDGFADRDRVRGLDAELVKGLEFDLVVLVETDAVDDDDDDGRGDGVTRAVDRYVAMTRATSRLVILDQ
ncbi:MAG TPA: AAA family ATPase, partial [Microbacterium sp.]|nr:AAA family ATPase [Microbacterium sp.]